MSRGKKAKKKVLRRRQEASSMTSSAHNGEGNSSAVSGRGCLSGTSKASTSMRYPLEGSEQCPHSPINPHTSSSPACLHSYRAEAPLPNTFTILFKGDELQKLRKVLQKSDLSETPLLLGAVVLSKTDLVKKLLIDGYPVDSCTADKSTALMWAVRNKNLESIDLLVQYGADLTLLDENRDNVALIAMQTASWDQNNFLDFWNSISYKIDLDHSNKRGNTILHYAIKRQWNVLVEAILKTEANVNCANVKGVTPLMMAGIRVNPSMVSALLRSHADVSQEDSKGCTALCYSIACTMQKKLEAPHPSLQKLVRAVHTEESNLTIDSYLKRRLELLIYPPEPANNFTSTVNSIIRAVFGFFIQYTQSGLKIFLHLDVFDKIREAADLHIENWVYLQAILGILVELLRYCHCWVGGGLTKISETDLMDLFTTAGLPDTCLRILKRYASDPTNNCMVASGLAPLFATCTTRGRARQWLKDNYHLLEPYYTKFLDECILKLNTPANEHHHLFAKMMKFRYLMTKLSQGDNVLETPPECLFRDGECLMMSDKMNPLFKPTDEYVLAPAVGSSKRQRRKVKTLKMKLAKMRNLTLSERNGSSLQSESGIRHFSKTARASTSYLASAGCQSDHQGSHSKIKSQAFYQPNSSAWKLMQKLKGEETNMHFKKIPSFNVTHECPMMRVGIPEDLSTDKKELYEAGDAAGVQTSDFIEPMDSISQMFNTDGFLEDFRFCESQLMSSDNEIDDVSRHSCFSELDATDNMNVSDLGNYPHARTLHEPLQVKGSLSEEQNVIKPRNTEVNKVCLIILMDLLHNDDTSLLHEQTKWSPNPLIYPDQIKLSYHQPSSVQSRMEYVPEDVEATMCYLSGLFEDIVSTYRKNWQRDRDMGYLGYRSGQGDPTVSVEEQMKIRKEEITRLNTILPKLEDSYIKKLKDSWVSLVTKVQQTADRNLRKFKDIVTLIQIHLLTHEVCPKDDFDKSNDKFISRTSLLDKNQKVGTIGDRASKKRKDLHRSIDAVECAEGYEAQETQYHLIHSVDTLLDDAVSSDSEVETVDTVNTQDRLRTTTYQCCEQGVFNQRTVPPNTGDTRAVVYTAQIIEALRTQVTVNSTHTFAELSRTSNAGVFSAIPTPPPAFQVRTTTATALTITENPWLARNRQALDVRTQPVIWGMPTTQAYVSRWDVLVKGLTAQSSKHARSITGDVTLSSPDQRKYFTISPGGNFGPIELGLDAEGSPLAIRRLGRDASMLIVPLLAPMLSLRHGHLLPFAVCADDGTEMVLGTPLCEYNLGEYLMCLKMSKGLEQRALTLVKQFLAGLCYLHTHGEPIVHGNIKPSNLMIDRAGVLRLAEFGLWKSLYRSSRPPSSSMIWFARESYKTYEEEEVLSCSCATDIQVAGMITHFILTGGLHPYGTQTSDILENILRGSPRIQSQGCEIVDLISWMLVYDPLDRPSINQVLMHVFFWDTNKKWSFLLACAGVTVNGTSLPLPLQVFHKDLESKALSDQVKGDWLSVVRTQFPTLIVTEDQYSDSPTGLLVFIRKRLESQPTACRSALQQFFLRAFPTLPLSLYRLLETTQWLSHPVFSPYTRLD